MTLESDRPDVGFVLMNHDPENSKPPVALVTGACGGIGKAVVDGFSELGARVFGSDICRCNCKGQEFIQCDATREPEVQSMVAAIDERAGRLNFLIHAAGLAGGGSLAETDLSGWREVIDANLTSAFLVARAAYPLLVRSKGAVVFCGSSNGYNGGSHLSGPAYAAAKAGIHNLTRYLAKEWAPDGIRVNAVAPGPVNTAMVGRLSDDIRAALQEAVPLGREGKPEEIAANILFLCSQNASWQTGSIVNISGGLVL